MHSLFNSVTLVDLILSIVIVIMSIIGYFKIHSATPLFIGVAFLLFGVSHAETLLGLKTGFLEPGMVIVRALGYISVCVGVQLIIREIILRMKIEEDLNAERRELERHIDERTAALSISNKEMTASVDALREIKQRIEFILGVTKTGLDIIDADHNIVYVDPEWAKIYGDYTGKKCYEYFMGRNEVCHDCGIEEAIELKASVVSDEVLVKEGSRPIQVTTIPFQDENGKWLVAEVNVDITERKKMENMLIQSEKLASLGRIVAEIAHEINNSLMIISGNAQITLMSKGLKPEVKNTLEIIMDESKKAKCIMHRVLKFAQPDKGEIKEVDICRSIEAVVGIIEKQLKLVNIEIKRIYPEKPIIALINDQLLQEVFMNILNNAKDAMSDGGVITIAVSSERDFLRIDFRDTGHGIPEKIKHNIFEPFFTTKENGTGLGLAICYGIIKAHNGEMKLESQLKKGTTATILLPAGNVPQV